MVKRVETIRDLRLVLETWRRRDETVGFLPTMGSLHAGHISLLRQAQSLSTRVVVSVFLNPMQFASDEDFRTYPRNSEMDEKLLSDNGCDLLFTPSIETMFPRGFGTVVDPGPIGKIFEGAVLPNHFAGVATVTTKLLLQVMPDYIFLGEKDYQQYRVVERVVNDLQIPVSIIPVPIYRDSDNLVTAAVNGFLSPEERELASLFPKTLEMAVEEIRAEHDIETTIQAGREQLQQAGFVVDYFEHVDTRSLEIVRHLKKPTRIISAIRVGNIRLLDNMAV
jgi:pantoate--beta-alanine ligase